MELDEDYDDFSEIPQFLKYAYNLPDALTKDDKLVDVFLPPRKRYCKSPGLPDKNIKNSHFGYKIAQSAYSICLYF